MKILALVLVGTLTWFVPNGFAKGHGHSNAGHSYHRIYRSVAAKDAFKRSNPCPANGGKR